MIKNIILLALVTVLVYNEASAYRTNKNIDSVTLNKEKKNREEIRKIIRYINGITNNNEKTDDQVAEPRNKKRYTMNTRQHELGDTIGSNDAESMEVRIHYIKNPKVLDEYIKKLRRGKSPSSDISNDRSYGEMTDVRRNAMFRTQGGSNENKEDTFNTENHQKHPISFEDQVTPFNPHYEDAKDINQGVDENKENNLNFDNPNTKRFKVKSKKGNFNDINKQITLGLVDKYDWVIEDEKPIKKKQKDNAKEVDWQDIIEKDELPKTEPNEFKKNLRGSRKGEKDLWDSKEIGWKKNKKTDNLDDTPRVQKKKNAKKWEEPKLKKKKVDDWDGPKKVKDDNDWDKVGKEWQGGKKQSFEDFGRTSRSWKQKKRNPVVYEKPSYVPRIPEHHKARGRSGDGLFQGRTPIPFIGKRGIYEDK